MQVRTYGAQTRNVESQLGTAVNYALRQPLDRPDGGPFCNAYIDIYNLGQHGFVQDVSSVHSNHSTTTMHGLRTFQAHQLLSPRFSSLVSFHTIGQIS